VGSRNGEIGTTSALGAFPDIVAAIRAAGKVIEELMPKIELGSVGAAVTPGDGDAFHAAATELETLGYSTLWLNGGQINDLGQVADLVRATRAIRVAPGIISVDRFAANAVAGLYAELEASHPGRFVVGLGGAHGAKPLGTLSAYLDHLDTVPPTVPVTSRVLAALGPRMLGLARDRTAGAFPVLVTPAYTAEARSLLGADTTLAVSQVVVLESDPERARAAARGMLGFLSTVGGYVANFRRMGFTDDDIAQVSDRLVDGVVAWGEVDAIAERVREHQRAGADHVAVSLLSTDPADPIPVGQWRRLAKALIE
jgi:probable F420-dependent oxidoreductase